MSELGPARMGAVLLLARDPARLADFYRLAFDLGSPHRGDDGHVGFRLANTYLGFDAAAPAGAPAPGRVSVWFDVPDCAASFDRLIELGATARTEPDSACSPGETLATVTDPEGNVVGLIGPA